MGQHEAGLIRKRDTATGCRAMKELFDFYIDGRWVRSDNGPIHDVINPATGRISGKIALADKAVVSTAVEAAGRALASYSQTSVSERLSLFEKIIGEYARRQGDMADAITLEMGAPSWLSRSAQAAMGLTHLKTAARILKDFEFETVEGPTLIRKEAIGVCGLITPWNWPANQIGCKVAPALATGCTLVLKPSEIAPYSARIWAEIMDAAGVPGGVFNLINGDGPNAGAALSSHPLVDMISFTGSTKAGIEVARNAAPTVKRVHQELGGKSPNIILKDANLDKAIPSAVIQVMMNSGQNCNAPTRLLVPHDLLEEVTERARTEVERLTVGAPSGSAKIGPVASKSQWDKVQSFIEAGCEEGATLVAGGLGRPEGVGQGYYVRPTLFSNVSNDMIIARDEIFGPVLCIMAYDSVAQAIQIANDTEYGLAAYIQGRDPERLREVARRLRAGQIVINGAKVDPMAPFGGLKRSGNGREWGRYGFDEFLEPIAVLGLGSLVESAGIGG